LPSKFVKGKIYDQRAFEKNATWVSKTAEFYDYFEFVEKIAKTHAKKLSAKKWRKNIFFLNFNTVCKKFRDYNFFGCTSWHFFQRIQTQRQYNTHLEFLQNIVLLNLALFANFKIKRG
jgi:hypothetical protein